MAEERANRLPDDRRRRLLKAGLAAAPAVVTLRSGGAWAMSTTGCVADAETRSGKLPEGNGGISESCQLSLGIVAPGRKGGQP